MGFATSGQIARVDVRRARQPADDDPDMLAASGDTPYFGANPQLDMTASIPGAQAGTPRRLAPEPPGQHPDALRSVC
jgi:hypothetical protein